MLRTSRSSSNSANDGFCVARWPTVLTWPSSLLSWTSPPTKFLPRMERMQERSKGASKIGTLLRNFATFTYMAALAISAQVQAAVCHENAELFDWPIGNKHPCRACSLRSRSEGCSHFILAVPPLHRCYWNNHIEKEHILLCITLALENMSPSSAWAWRWINPRNGPRVTVRVMSPNIPAQVRWYFAHRP